jgi:hypothetical protein
MDDEQANDVKLFDEDHVVNIDRLLHEQDWNEFVKNQTEVLKTD